METGNKIQKIITAIGIALLMLIIAGKLGAFRPAPEPGPVEAPAPAIEIAAASAGPAGPAGLAGPGGPCVIRYYPRTDFPDKDSVPVEEEIEYGGDAYVFYRVSDGLASTKAGDCWEVTYSLKGE